jgi:putative transposase
MPRPPRLHVPGGHYHVILRGNHREPLFSTPQDRCALNRILAEVVEGFQIRVHAFCWMTNHLHALIQVADRPLGESMKRVAMRYSRYRHKTLRTTGHLFERRYKAKLVDVDEYFLTLLRYIHRNPVKAGMVSEPSQYRWSSHRMYLGEEVLPWVTADFGLSLFSSDLVQARAAYKRFVEDSSKDDDELEEEVHPEDARVLGRDSFIEKLPFIPLKPRNPMTLAQLATLLCAEHGVTVERLRSRSCSRVLTPVRLRLAEEAIDQRVGTLSEVARFLDRDLSTLCKLLARARTKCQ